MGPWFSLPLPLPALLRRWLGARHGAAAPTSAELLLKRRNPPPQFLDNGLLLGDDGLLLRDEGKQLLVTGGG
jgi:hypothetical protein